MTATSRRHTADVGTISAIPLPFGVGLLLGGAATLWSVAATALTSSTGGDGDLSSTLLVAIISITLGLGLIRLRPSVRKSPPVAMAMLVAGWVGIAVSGLMAMIISGAFDGAGDALFETVSATTTTGFTTVADPQTLPQSVRMLRVSLQWVSGLGVLVVGMGVLPVAVSGAELTAARPLLRSKRIVTSAVGSFRNIIALYSLLTTVLMVGYFALGMSTFDAMSYALSTASTGGMANHAASIGHFESAPIEWLATAGMIAAGGNLMIVWWVMRGAIGSAWRSTELRLYASLLALGSVVVWMGNGGLSIRDAAFSVSSMLSTTGFRAANWADGGSFVEAILLVGVGIGAMSGSVGSGVRLARVARVALEVRRGLLHLLYPNRVEVVRMDGHAVDEDSLQYSYGFLWMHLITLGSMAALVNVARFDVVGTLTFTLSAVSNVGVMIEGETITSYVAISGWSQLIASIGMVLGRLSIYPVLITLAGLFRWFGRLRPGHEIGVGR